MERDQLLLYARNHRASLWYQLIVAAIFLFFRHWMYGLPEGLGGWLTEAVALTLCPFMLMRQIGIYHRILEKGETLKQAEYQSYIAEIGINKLVYMVPWLLFLFWPLETKYLYNHFLGYVFVFAAVAAYASASAAVLPLLLFDIGIPAIFAMGVVLANLDVQETGYVGLGILVLCLYAYIIGRTIRESTQQLISTKYQLKKAARAAAEASKAKSSFLALMSHEIRTPMTGIFGMIDFLKETKLSDEQRSFVTTISECSRTLLNTLNDILDFSKVESGKLSISKINFDFHSVLQNSVRILQQIADDKGVALKLDIAPDLPQAVHGDPHRIQQIIVNLLNNAVKFTKAGSVTLKAAFLPGDKPMIRVEVTDTGIGISPENIGKLFTAFSQADTTISRKFGGTGLGLSIAKSLIGLMGGRIDVVSEEGKGSTFWFELPYEPPGAETASAEAAAEGTDRDLPPMKILVAEDNVINARIISKLLAHRGHQVTVVHNGQEAVKAAQIHPYDLVFMDVNMPVMNGIEATQAIRALGEKFRRTPIIGLTANVLDEYVRRCREAGMVGHVAKPFAPETVFKAMAEALRADSQISGSAVPPDAAPAAYTVVGQKKVLANAPKSMEEVLVAMRDELGHEYLAQTIANDLQEVRQLLDRVMAEHRDGNIEGLTKAAHDLKSVSGLIGMQASSSVAAQIQDDCLNGERGRLAELVEKLGREIPAEAVQAEDFVRNMPAA